jgi:hypothetical protein
MNQKPKLGTRANHKPVDPIAAEAFLLGRNPVESASAAPPPPPQQVTSVPTRKVVRRTTIIMGDDLARRLAVFAATHDTDQTAVIKAALEAWLDAHP